MKNVIRERLITGLALAVIAIIIIIVESTYTREAIVDRIEDGYVVLVDTTDNEWLYETEELFVGEEVKMIMNNNGTEDCFHDDVIKKIIVERKVIE